MQNTKTRFLDWKYSTLLSKSEFALKKVLILVACTSLLAACHQHPAPQAAAPVAQASGAEADAAASSPEITYSNASKPATYDPNLKPAPASVTLNLGSAHQ